MTVGYLLSTRTMVPGTSASLGSIEAAIVSLAVYLTAARKLHAGALASAACVLVVPCSLLLLVSRCSHWLSQRQDEPSLLLTAVMRLRSLTTLLRMPATPHSQIES